MYANKECVTVPLTDSIASMPSLSSHWMLFQIGPLQATEQMQHMGPCHGSSKSSTLVDQMRWSRAGLTFKRLQAWHENWQQHAKTSEGLAVT